MVGCDQTTIWFHDLNATTTRRLITQLLNTFSIDWTMYSKIHLQRWTSDLMSLCVQCDDV